MRPLDARLLRRRLAALSGIGDAVVSGSTGSTNDDVRRLAAEGAPDGTVVIAEGQTAGRGRHGRTWHSPPGLGLYVSALFRPGGRAEDAARWTAAAAVAACRAARAAGAAEVAIKWPNDLVWRGRKVAGTLAELRSAAGEASEVVVGTGFNVLQGAADFPAALAETAASLAMAGAAGRGREDLAASYLGELLRLAAMLRAGRWQEVLADWSALAPGAEGGRVRVLPGSGSPPFEATTAGVDARGALRVRARDGGTHTLTLAESVIPLEG